MSHGAKSHTLKIWSRDWTESSTHEVILFDSLKEDLINAGIPADIVFNEDGDAYVIEVKGNQGVLEIGPGTLTSINGNPVLTSRASGINVYRPSGETVPPETADAFEADVLSVISKCR